MNLTILKDRIVLLIILTGLIFRIIAGSIIPPGYDEAYYGVYSFFPSSGYFDHPPLVALTAGLGHWISGSFSFLSLRIGAFLLFIGSNVLIYSITELLYGRKAARLSVIFLHVIPYFLFGIGAFVIPDNALGFFWLLFIFALVKVNKTKNSKWFLLAGTAGGLALLSKYHAVLLFAGLFCLLICDKSWRQYLTNKHFYFAILISFLIFLPNIIWNYQHDWISYLYQFAKGTGKSSFSFSLFLQGIGIQAGYLLPWHMIVLIIAIIKTFKSKNKNGKFLIYYTVIPILVFTLVGFTQRILPHWPMPGYIVAIILASGLLNKWKDKTLKIYFSSTALITLLIIIAVSLQATNGIFNLNKKTDVTLDGFGWKQLASHISENNKLQNAGFFFTHKWFLSGELGWAIENNKTVTIFNKREPHGFAFWNNPEELSNKDGIFVCTDRYKYDIKKEAADYFDSIEKLDDFLVYRNGKVAKTFYMYYCTNLKQKFEWDYGK